MISVDTKKREPVGNFKNAGLKWDRSPVRCAPTVPASFLLECLRYQASARGCASNAAFDVIGHAIVAEHL